MSDLRLVVVPVGRLDPVEVEAAAARVSKIFNRPVELRATAPVPRATEDAGRGQHRAGPFLTELRASLVRLSVAKLVGGAAAPPGQVPVAAAAPDAVIFVTDCDLFTPSTDSVFGEMDARSKSAVFSVRRLREAFYRRKADPARQRARVVKVLLHAIGRLKGLPDCREARCAMGTTATLADIDLKDEKYCAACWRRLSGGVVRM